MAYYIGIDLGTTNSAIVTFDGEKTRIWKTVGQTDVTPSCIYIDKKGRKYYGNKAYKQLMLHEDRVAKQFKRFMGTSTKIHFADETMTPEECSAEILRELFRCLPEDISRSDDRYTVITVPAAFDQMQNEATKKAAQMANIGKVAVMQEPVAAIMSVVNGHSIKNGTFLIFDMGGGTLDVAIANCLNGKVDVIAHGGIAMCGGADIDRRIVDNVIKPWLLDNGDYNIPKDFIKIPKYQKLLQRARYRAEEAKINLSSEEETTIEGTLGPDITDENGEEIELDIDFSREDLNAIIRDIADEAVTCARETIQKSGIPAADFERVVFIGGPCNYKPLRDYVSRELGIKNDGLEVNPMTAVAEGASIYAESIDWTTVEHERKANNKSITSNDLGLKFKFEARTTKDKARFAIMLKAPLAGYTVQVSSADTGWESGLMELQSMLSFVLPLSRKGDNTFEITIYDDNNRKVQLEQNTIVITKTLSTVGSILASHTISVEVRTNSLSETTTLDPLVREGDKLPLKGVKKYKSTEMIKAGDARPDACLKFKLWEGNITSNISDNKFIGMIKIAGTDLDYGSIRPGEDIEFEYTINEAESLEVSLNIERLGITLNGQKNLYSTTDAEKDMGSEDYIQEVYDEGCDLANRVDELGKNIADSRIEEVRRIAEAAQALADETTVDPELVKKNADNIVKAKKILDKIQNDNLSTVHQMEFENISEEYESDIVQFCSPTEKNEFERMFSNLKQMVDRKDKTFEGIANDIRRKFIQILFDRSKPFVGGMFNYLRARPYSFMNREKYTQLTNEGIKAINADDFEKLKAVVVYMLQEQRTTDVLNDMGTLANIMKG